MDRPPYVELDTRLLPITARFEAWASGMPAYHVTKPRPQRGFSAVVRAWLLSPIVVTHSILDPVRWRRTDTTAASDGQDSLTLQIFLSGRMRWIAEGRLMRVRTGEIALQDAARPMDATTTRSNLVTVTLPRALLDETLPGYNVHGLVLSGGAAVLLASFLRQLPRALESMDRAGVARLPAILRDLLTTAIVSTGTDLPAVEAERPLGERARRFIAHHLSEQLTVTMIQAGVNASRASLYRAFAGAGGVMAFVLNRRLERVRRILNNHADERTITEIAIATGFRNGSDLGRAYRRRFGMAPGTARRACQTRRHPAGSVQHQFRQWVEDEC